MTKLKTLPANVVIGLLVYYIQLVEIDTPNLFIRQHTIRVCLVLATSLLAPYPSWQSADQFALLFRSTMHLSQI